MKNYKGNFLSVLGVAVTLLVVVEGDIGKNMREAFNILPPLQRTALQALAPSFLENIISIATCIDKKATPIDLCNFKTSYDPLYYLQECAKNTTIQPIIEKFVQGIPVVKVPFGIPNKVSDKRCFLSTSPFSLGGVLMK